MDMYDKLWERDGIVSLKINTEVNAALDRLSVQFSAPEGRTALKEYLARRGLTEATGVHPLRRTQVSKSTLINLAILEFLSRIEQGVIVK